MSVGDWRATSSALRIGYMGTPPPEKDQLRRTARRRVLVPREGLAPKDCQKEGQGTPPWKDQLRRTASRTARRTARIRAWVLPDMGTRTWIPPPQHGNQDSGNPPPPHWKDQVGKIARRTWEGGLRNSPSPPAGRTRWEGLSEGPGKEARVPPPRHIG